MGPIIFEAKFLKEELLKLPKKERTLFLALSHFSNEITILLKVLLITGKAMSNNNAEIQGNLAQSFFFLKLLAGKLFEGKKLFSTPLFSEYSALLSEEGKKDLTGINKSFSKKNDIIQIRNNYAFHYPTEKLEAIFPEIDEDLLVYFEKGGRGNNLYYFAEVVANMALLKSINPTDVQGVIKHLTNEMVVLSEWFLVVCDEIIISILDKNLSNYWEGNFKKVEFNKLIPINDVKLPWFIDYSEIEDSVG